MTALMRIPFPFPAHQTGRADFPHPAFRLDSLQGSRRRSNVHASKPQNAEFPENNVTRKFPRPAPLHFVPSSEEVSHAIINMIVDGPIRLQPRAIAEVGRPTDQKPV